MSISKIISDFFLYYSDVWTNEDRSMSITFLVIIRGKAVMPISNLNAVEDFGIIRN